MNISPRVKAVLTGGLGAVVSLAFFGQAVAQSWTELLPSGGAPDARHQATAVLDGVTNRMIIFGGQLGPGVCVTDSPTNDVWVLENADGTGGTPIWTELDPTGALPDSRVEHSALYDANTNRMIVFGGANPGVGVFGDLWVLTNANGADVGTPEWILLSPSADSINGVPDARRVHAAVYDSANNRMILAQGAGLDDLWVLTNANGLGGTPQWTELFATGELPPLGPIFHAGYDPATNRMMILITPSGELRVLENANGMGGTPNWVLRSPSGQVPSESPFSILFGFNYGAYDPSADRYFMFGGFDGVDGERINDTFILEDANDLTVTPTWTLLIPTGVLPSNRDDSSVALNAAGNRMIAFAGRDFTGTCPGGSGVVYNDTWVLNPDAGPTYSCVGFEPPFDVALTLKKKAKRAIPLKLVLEDFEGFAVTDADIVAPPVVNVLFAGNVFGESPPDDADLLPLGKANEGNIFRFDEETETWVYNLGTKQFEASGTYSVTAVSGDDTEYMINPTCTGSFERLD